MAQIDQLFKIMVQNRASDLHLRAGASPFLRINGRMVALNYRELTPEEIHSLVFEILEEKNKQKFLDEWELDTSYSLPGVGRFRCNVFIQRQGMSAVFRVIPEKIKTVEELNLPKNVLQLTKAHKGLVLVTGPTGSGKSTTLAAMIHDINTSTAQHIITVEDPIEFIHNSHKSLINQREVGSHTKSFANALKSALREDPDIILVGEMRDLETISLALTAAETGHLVFGTLHTNGAAKTIDRIIDVFPTDQQAQIRVMLSDSLLGVISQTLFPRIDEQGRVAALEILINNNAVANLIREGKTHQIPSSMQTGAQQGMITYKQSLDNLVQRSLISKNQANEFLGIQNDTPSTPSPVQTTKTETQKSAPTPTTPPNIGTKAKINTKKSSQQTQSTVPKMTLPFLKKR